MLIEILGHCSVLTTIQAVSSLPRLLTYAQLAGAVLIVIIMYKLVAQTPIIYNKLCIIATTINIEYRHVCLWVLVTNRGWLLLVWKMFDTRQMYDPIWND